MACVIAPSSPVDSTAPSETSGPVDTPVDGSLLELARRVAQEEAGSADRVGDFLGSRAEDDVASTLSFAALDPGYRGWRWSVTVAQVGDDAPTVSEVLLLPGDEALVPPPWLPWAERVRGQDVGPGDLHPVGPDDERLVPGYLESDDPAIEDVALEVGLGRTRVLGILGRLDAAERWHAGEFGPETAMAEQAPASCISCGFYVPLAGALGAALGACANEFSPADGRVVDAAFGCGAHSETEIDMPMLSALPDIALDDGVLDVYRRGGNAAVVDDDRAEVGAVDAVDGAEVVSTDDHGTVEGGTDQGGAGGSAPTDTADSVVTEPLFDDEGGTEVDASDQAVSENVADEQPSDGSATEQGETDVVVPDPTATDGAASDEVPFDEAVLDQVSLDEVPTDEVPIDGPLEISDSEPVVEDAVVSADAVLSEAPASEAPMTGTPVTTEDSDLAPVTEPATESLFDTTSLEPADDLVADGDADADVATDADVTADVTAAADASGSAADPTADDQR
nr:DUF3027 domain-containing protein [Nakamurella flavida]